MINSLFLSEIRALTLNDEDIFLKNTNPLIFKAREDLKKYLKLLLRSLKLKYKFHAIISCTFYYRQDREWENAGQSIGLPFFVLHKENMKDPVTHKRAIDRYKRRNFVFNGQKLFLANKLEEEVILKAHCANKNQIEVCGSLRMDKLFKSLKCKNKFKKDKIVLFSTHHVLGLLELPSSNGVFVRNKEEGGFIEHLDIYILFAKPLFKIK